MRGWIVVALLGGVSPVLADDEERVERYPQSLPERPPVLPEGVYQTRVPIHAMREPDFGGAYSRFFTSPGVRLGLRGFELNGGAAAFLFDVPRQPRSSTPPDRIYAGYVGVARALSPGGYVGGSLSVRNWEIVDASDVLEFAPRITLGHKWRGPVTALSLGAVTGMNFLYETDADKIPMLGGFACGQLALTRRVALTACGSVSGYLANTDSVVEYEIDGGVTFTPTETVDVSLGIAYREDVTIVTLAFAGRYFARRR